MISLKGKRIVVTGGAGFIGSHVVDALIREGAKVTVVDDLSTGRKENLASAGNQMTFVKETIVNTRALTEIFAGREGEGRADAICHLAAVPSVPKSVANPTETHEANATGTLSVFVAAMAARVPRVVYASSSSVYGDTPVLPKIETMPVQPLSPYAAQKLMTEIYGRIFFNLHGLETVGLRYFNVFGPRQNPDSEYAAVIPKFIKLMKRGEQPHIYGDGTHTRDFTYVSNVVDANIAALKTAVGFGESYNIAAGVRISLNQMVESINIIIGTSLKPLYEPPRAGDIKDSFADIAKAAQVLGYTPNVSFEDGLRLTADSIS